MLFEKKVELLRKEKHQGRETSEFLLDVKKLAEGAAFEYLMGKVMFAETVVDLSSKPMIPRKETEYWVEQAVHAVRGSDVYQEAREKEAGTKPLFRALDLYSGSGCVGLALLKHLDACHVTFIELDPKLKHQIELSCDLNKFSPERYEVKTGSVYDGALGTYDVIFAVPPYVPLSMKDEVMKELHAEPSLAFFDPEGGYFFHKKTLERAKEFLKEGATLFFEFDMTQRTSIEKLIREQGFFKYSFLTDPYGHDCAVAISLTK